MIASPDLIEFHCFPTFQEQGMESGQRRKLLRRESADRRRRLLGEWIWRRNHACGGGDNGKTGQKDHGSQHYPTIGVSKGRAPLDLPEVLGGADRATARKSGQLRRLHTLVPARRAGRLEWTPIQFIVAVQKNLQWKWNLSAHWLRWINLLCKKFADVNWCYLCSFLYFPSDGDRYNVFEVCLLCRKRRKV